MAGIPTLLTPVKVKLDDILLDPNNPRFAELGQPDDVVPENRFNEPKVQQVAYDRMRDSRFDVPELRDTIKNLGFLPMDRVVVRKWRGPVEGKYVVVEGNRRITALKWLVELNASGRETFSQEQIDNFTNLEALLLNDQTAPERIKWILPGLRHVSGIKEWGPYQKARAVFLLRESGLPAQEAAQSLGLSTKKANSLWRGYLALEQMKQDEEYGEHVKPSHYSYFEELFKRPNISTWLSWNDTDRRFTNAAGVREFYSWMLGEIDENGDLKEAKLPEAKSLRELGDIFDDPKAMAVFRGPEGTLSSASARFTADHPQEWRPAVVNAESVLAALSADNLRALSDADLKDLESLLKRVDQVMKDRVRLSQQ
jgi:hypothetical protein